MNKDCLKYRVFDTAKKEYVSAYLYLTPQGECWEIDEHQDYYEYTDIIVEKCTGLTDLHGKLIYEGDIVEFTYFDYNGKDYQIEGTIEYGELGLMLRKANKGHEDFLCAGDDLYFYAWLGEFDFDPNCCFEIIGNVHTGVHRNENL